MNNCSHVSTICLAFFRWEIHQRDNADLLLIETGCTSQYQHQEGQKVRKTMKAALTFAPYEIPVTPKFYQESLKKFYFIINILLLQHRGHSIKGASLNPIYSSPALTLRGTFVYKNYANRNSSSINQRQ